MFPNQTEGKRLIKKEVFDANQTVSVHLVTPMSEINYHIRLANQAFNAEDLSEAKTFYTRILHYNPTHVQSLFALASIAIRHENLQEAESYYRRILQISSHNLAAKLGLLLIDVQSSLTEKEKQLKSLLGEFPLSALVHGALADNYSEQKAWGLAKDYYTRAIAIDETRAEYFFNLAICHEQLQEKADAVLNYQRALALVHDRYSPFDILRARARVTLLEGR